MLIVRRGPQVHREGGVLRRSSIAAAAILILTFGLIGSNSLSAEAQAPARNRAPGTPTNLATEYPQPVPVLHATFVDPDGGTGNVLYTILDPTGIVVLQDAAGAVVSSGYDSPFVIPVGTLVDGVQYSWSARSFDRTAYSARTTEPDYFPRVRLVLFLLPL